MREKVLKFLGLMRKAGALVPGEVNTGSAVHTGKAKLLLLASDASENARHRAETFTFGRSVLTAQLPFTKEELAGALGTGSVSMAAVEDLGFAKALCAQLEEMDPDAFGELAREVAMRQERAERRKKQTASRAGTKRTGKRRTI